MSRYIFVQLDERCLESPSVGKTGLALFFRFQFGVTNMTVLSHAWQAILQSNMYHVRDAAINLYGLYLKRQRFNAAFWSELDRLQASEWLTLAEKEQAQCKLLAAMIQHAYEHVPFYRRRFDEYGIHPKQIQSIADLAKIPVLTKDDIRKNYDTLLATNVSAKSYLVHHTSGTTGTKLRFAISKQLHWTLKTAHLYRHYAWAGVNPGDRRVTLGGRAFAAKPPYWIYNRWENQLLLSIHHLTHQTANDYLAKIKEFAPVFLQGHPSGLARLAEYMCEAGQSYPVKAVFTTGETLLPDQREQIAAAFQCLVFDFYGQGEALFHAGECDRQRGYHGFSELGVIELQPVPNPGNLALVIGTSLHNFAMPMLRYQVGDLAQPVDHVECSCGRGLPLQIAHVVGRVDDRIYFSLHPQDYILPATIRMYIKPYLQDGQNYQLYQRDFNCFELYLVADKRISSEQKGKLRQMLCDVLGSQAHITVEQRETLLTKGGKMRNIISNIRPTDSSAAN
ncbi:MAG: hypothetical protein MI924_05625 [Chloroflexales bacterium]|nr:hypothetical protein [Chloroflexales bacterium]